MPVVPGGAYQQGPSCFDRMKLGFTIGFCVGMASGALFGGFSALRYSTHVHIYIYMHYRLDIYDQIFSDMD